MESQEEREDTESSSEREDFMIVALNAPKKPKKEGKKKKLYESSVSLTDTEFRRDDEVGNEGDDDMCHNEKQEEKLQEKGKDCEQDSNEYTTIETTENVVTTGVRFIE